MEPFYNDFHNILRRFDILRNIAFTTSEMMRHNDPPYKKARVSL